MKTTPLKALIALLLAPATIAQSRETAAASATTTSVAPTCTASQIASLCDYKDPGPEFAVASDGRASCWEYCNDHQPCNFVIFAKGNPNTGTGTCWLYPGETFDASAGSTDCGNPWLEVYSQPECSGGSPTATSGACSATATPSVVASVCGYPTPGDCFDTCYASDGASQCLSLCAKADSCSYVVFNPHNPTNSPFGSGTCWVYPDGTFDAGAATTCSGEPEQYVYDNLCPKPSPSPVPTTSASSSSSGSATSSSTGAVNGESGKASARTASTIDGQNAASSSFSLPKRLVLGVAIVMGLGL